MFVTVFEGVGVGVGVRVTVKVRVGLLELVGVAEGVTERV